VNDNAERAIALMTLYNSSLTGEQMHYLIWLVERHRKQPSVSNLRQDSLLNLIGEISSRL